MSECFGCNGSGYGTNAHGQTARCYRCKGTGYLQEQQTFRGKVYNSMSELRKLQEQSFQETYGTGGSKKTNNDSYSSYSSSSYQQESEERKREQRKREQREREAQIRKERAENQRRLQEMQQRMAAQQQAAERLRQQQQQQHAKELADEKRRREEEKKRIEKKSKIDSLNTELIHKNESIKYEINKFEIENNSLIRKNKIYLRNISKYDKMNKLLIKKHYKILENPNMFQIVLLGRTGCGKSTWANRMSGKYGKKGPFKATYNVQSETQKIKNEVVCNNNINYNNNIMLVDTPGIYDSNNNDLLHANELISFLKGSGGINAFLIIINPSGGRLDQSEQDILMDLQYKLGKGFWKHVIIIVTHKDNIDDNGEDDDDDDDDDEYKQNYNYNNPGWNKWSKDYVFELKKKFDLNINIPIFGVNNKHKQSCNECLRRLFNKIPRNKFNCKELKSLIHDLKNKINDNKKELIEIIKIRNQYENNINNLKNKTNDIINQLKNINNNNYQTPQYITKILSDINTLFNNTKIKINFIDLNNINIQQQQNINIINNNNNNNNNDDETIDCGYWKCSRCTFTNSSFLNRCEMCNNCRY